MAAAFGAGSLAPAATADTGEFHVMTYNVKGLPPILGDRTRNIENVARSLERYRASLAPSGAPKSFIALQEVFSRRYRDLMRPSAYTFASRKSDRGWAGLGDGLLLLSDLPVDGFDRTRWKQCCGSFGRSRSDCDAGKGFTFARVFVEENLPIDVYVLHADAGMDAGSRRARCQNYRQLVATIEERSPKGTAVLVLGDTNGRFTRGEENLHELLTVAGLTDVWVELRRGGKVPPAGDPIRTTCLTDPSSGQCELKDKVLYRSGSNLRLSAQSYEALQSLFSNRRGESFSDHYPVVVRFRYRKILPAADLAHHLPADSSRAPQIAAQ